MPTDAPLLALGESVSRARIVGAAVVAAGTVPVAAG